MLVDHVMTKGGGFDHRAKCAEHMARRRSHGLTYQQLGDEFGKAKSTAHKTLNKTKKGDDMPSKTEKQARTMAAAAHDKKFAKKVGIPQKVAKDFNKADAGTGKIKPKKQKKKEVMRDGFKSYGSAS